MKQITITNDDLADLVVSRLIQKPMLFKVYEVDHFRLEPRGIIYYGITTPVDATTRIKHLLFHECQV